MMNERIIDMAKQCGYWSGQTIEMNDAGIMMFADLILQECLTICKDTAEKQFNPLYNRESDGATVCYKKIVEHFGVK